MLGYLVAVLENHVYKLFPYISDTGTSPPESCIFGQMLNIGAFLMLITMYIRYRAVQLIRHRGFPSNYNMWNNISSLFGTLSCIGMSLVGNFQETSQITVHFIGAFLAFVLGAIYCIIQGYMSWLSYSSILLKSLRIFLSGLLIPLYINSLVCSTLSFKEFDGNALKWNNKNPAYALHLVATFSEWIMAVVMILFIATFYVEFKLLKFQEIIFVLREG